MLSLSQSPFLSFVSFILSSVCTYIPSTYWYNVPFSQYSRKILQVFSGWHRKQWNTQLVENLFIIFPFGNPLINSLGNIWDAVYKVQVCGFTGKSWSICMSFLLLRISTSGMLPAGFSFIIESSNRLFTEIIGNWWIRMK